MTLSKNKTTSSKLNNLSRTHVLVILLLLFLIASYNKLGPSLKLLHQNNNDVDFYFLSESAIHYHYAKMFSEDGRIPIIDYKAQYPEGLQTYNYLSISMEAVTGYLHRILSIAGIKVKFHVFLIYFICFFSSISVFILFLITRDLFNNDVEALVSTALYATALPLFARTIGWFIREDFCLPFIFLSLYFFNKAIKKPLPNSMAAGACFFIALASWHFTSFYLLIFTLSIIILLLINENQSESIITSFSVFVAFCFLAGLIIPVLKTKCFDVSFPMLLCYSTLLTFYLRKHIRITNVASLVIVIVFSGILFIILNLVNVRNAGDYSHAYYLIIYKLKYLLCKPETPSSLPYEVRAIWQEACNSPTFKNVLIAFFPSILLAFPTVINQIKKTLSKKSFAEENIILLLLFFTFGWYVAIERLMVFFVFFAAIYMGHVLSDEFRKYYKTSGTMLLVIAVVLGVQTYKALNVSKYYDISRRFDTEKDLIQWIRNSTKEEDVFLTLFNISPNILAYADRTINLHSMFEDKNLREKVKRFNYTLFSKEDEFYTTCVNFKTSYFIYSATMLLDKKETRPRYWTDNLQLKKKAVVYSFHFYPEKLDHFELVYQNNWYRVYKVLNNGEKRKNFKLFYRPIFNPKVFNENESEEYFNDNRANLILKELDAAANYCYMAIDHFNKREYNESIRCYEDALKIDPYNEMAYYFMGNVQFTIGNLEQGIKSYKKAVELGYESSDLYRVLGQVYMQMGKKKEAYYNLKKGLLLNPEDNEIQKLLISIQK